MENRGILTRQAMNYGLVMALVLILLSLTVWALKLESAAWFQYFNWAVLITVLYIFLKNFRDRYHAGVIRYGQAVGAGVLIFFFASVIYALYTVIYNAYIDPHAIDRSLDLLEELYNQRGFSEAQIEAAMNLAQRMRTPALLAFSAVFGTTLTGLILSLIVSIFVQRKGNSFTETMEEVD
ncbi:MAG: DUF4199 domain-containing protein [Bacteroidales bacterium]|nr:DUF4199 domain-containing protein [Bacteroidales bacterium]